MILANRPEARRRVLHGGAVTQADPTTFEYLGHGYGRDATTVRWGPLAVPALDPARTHALAGDYATDGTRVVWHASELDGVHAPSFEVLGVIEHFAIARDRHRLYTHEDALEGPDAPTFELLGARIGADRNGLWSVANRGCVQLEGDRVALRILDADYASDGQRAWYRGAPLEGCDGRTLRVLGHGCAVDAETVFRHGQILGARPADFAVLDAHYAIVAGRVWSYSALDDADASTFRALGNKFGTDARHVFFDGAIVDGADPETFVVLTTGEASGWARDRGHIWYRRYEHHDYSDGESLAMFEGVDPSELVPLDGVYARAGEVLLRGLDRVEGVDAASFRVLGEGWYADRAAVWLEDRRVAGADPTTLVVCGAYAIVDLAEPDITVIGDGYARTTSSVMFAGSTLEGPSPDARSLGGGYLVDPDSAWFFELATESRKMPDFVATGGRIEDADPATLRRDRAFALDRGRVFSGRVPLAAHPAKFRALDAHHGSDGDVAYFHAHRMIADPAKLRVLGGGFRPRGYTLATVNAIADAWATDGTILFVAGHPVWDRRARYLSDDTEAALRALDVASFRVLDTWWGTDGHVVVSLDDSYITPLHAPSFEVLGDGYARDISQIWSSAGRLRDANPSTFRVLGDGYAIDGNRAWYRGTPIPDVASPLRHLGGGWARDAAGILCGTTRVDADPDSFVVVGSPLAAENEWDPRALAIHDPLWLHERVAVGRDRERAWWSAYTTTPANAVAIGHGYALTDTEVFHAGNRLAADAVSFVAIGEGYARDAHRAFYDGRVTL